MELFRNHKPRPKRRHIYDTTKTTHFGRYFWRLSVILWIWQASFSYSTRKSHALSKIFYRTYNQFWIISLISQNRYATALIIPLLPYSYLILQVLKHMSLKTIPNMTTTLLNSLKLMQKPITLTVEKSINYFKDSFKVANRKTANKKLYILIYFSPAYLSS